MGQDQSHEQVANEQDGAQSNGISIRGAAGEATTDEATNGVAIRGAAAETANAQADIVSFKGAAAKTYTIASPTPILGVSISREVVAITTRTSAKAALTSDTASFIAQEAAVSVVFAAISEQIGTFARPEQRESQIRPSYSPQFTMGAAARPSNANPTSYQSNERIDFNGLRAVPTGPKTVVPESEWPRPIIRNLQDVDPAIRASCHAFISRKWLPCKYSTLRHLTGFASRRNPKRVYVDDSGYYITFEDDEEGHRNLDILVAAAPSRDKLFGTYILHLEAFHHGQPAYQQTAVDQQTAADQPPVDDNPGQAAATNGAAANDGTDAELPEVQPVSLEKPVMPQTPMLETRHQTSRDPRLHGRPHEQSSAESESNALGQSSPLRVPSRLDGDDASSISGKTTASSDLSAARRAKCHVCNTVSAMDLDGLASCSSCPRRYHRRCHTSPPVPSAVVDCHIGRSWQCRRCVRKQVALPNRASVGFAEAANSPALPTPSQDERPEKRPKLGGLEGHAAERTLSTIAKSADYEAAVAEGPLNGTEATKASATADRSPPGKRPVGDYPDLTVKSGLTFQTHEKSPAVPVSRNVDVETHSRTSEASGLTKAQGPGACVPAQPNNSKTLDIVTKTPGIDDTQPQPNSGDSHFDDALDLVEKSFANSVKDVAPATAPTRKSLMLVRKKIARPQQDLDLQTVATEMRPAASSVLNPEIASAAQPAAQPAAKAPTLLKIASVTNGAASPNKIAHSSGASTAVDAPQPLRDRTPLGQDSGTDHARQQPRASGSLASAPVVNGTSHLPRSSGNGGPLKPTAKRTRAFLVKCRTCLTVNSTADKNAPCKKCKGISTAGAKPVKDTLASPAPSSEKVAEDKVPERGAGTSVTTRLDDGSNRSMVHANGKESAPLVPSPDEEPTKQQMSTSVTIGAQLPVVAGHEGRSTDTAESEMVATAEMDGLNSLGEDGQKPSIECIHSNSKSATDAPSSGTVPTVCVTDPSDLAAVRDPGEELKALGTPTVTVTNAESDTARNGMETPVTAATKVRSVDTSEGNGQRTLRPPEEYPETGAEKEPNGGDDLSDGELSEAPTTPDRASPSATNGRRKRRSFIGGEGLGNATKRPEGTYLRLIGMALCEAPNHRLQMRGLQRWIHSNIPGYDWDVGKWRNGISTTVSAHTGDKGKRWFKIITWKDGDSEEYGKSQWAQLRPDVAETHERWDPVLKKPVSPSREWRSRQDAQEADGKLARDTQDSAPEPEPEPVVQQREASPSEVVRDRCAKARTAKARAARAAKRIEDARKESTMPAEADHMDVDESHTLGEDSGDAAALHGQTVLGDATESSDDEPLALLRRDLPKSFVAPAAMMQLSPASLEDEDKPQDLMDLDVPPSPDKLPILSAEDEPKAEKARPPRLNQVQASNMSLAQLIKLEAENIDYSAKSLFDEWPEYDPANQFDKEAKIAEIKKRPTRKQMFGKPAMYSRLGSNNETAKPLQAARTSTPNSLRGSAERTKRPTSFSAFPLEENVTHYDTLEEFFDLPANPIPFIHHGQLAYRDGTRDENGKLPRAKIIYKTGPH
ncbi:hypothetical protein LTR85_009985 [Meristemomyces frigidus]|nr:hypothetical protein LTR85_009985 [Meristemomyces frigidus]